jgi:transposase
MGIDGIKDKRKKISTLTKSQRDHIIEILKTKKPRDFGFSQDYWTTLILGHLISEQYGIKYKSMTSLYLIFKDAKFSFHKPGKVYKNRNEQLVKQWKEDLTPILGKLWVDEKVELFAGDEMILSSITTFQKIWLPIMQYPKIEVSNKKENRSLYGFLNIKQGIEHAFVTEKQNMYISVEMLKNLRKIYPNKKLVIFWDNAGWHKGSAVQEFLQIDKNIEIIHFPAYAPEENPQERVWKSGRKNASHNRYIDNIEAASKEFANFLNNTFFEYSLLGFKSNVKM